MSKSPKSIIPIIVKILSPFAEFAYLMGSAETPRFRKESDVDLAFFPKGEMSREQIQDLWVQLEKALERDVDLVSLKNIDPIFGRQVLEAGRVILVNNPTAHLIWKAHQLSIYPDFKRSREVIEKNLLVRKKYE